MQCLGAYEQHMCPCQHLTPSHSRAAFIYYLDYFNGVFPVSFSSASNRLPRHPTQDAFIHYIHLRIFDGTRNCSISLLINLIAADKTEIFTIGLSKPVAYEWNCNRTRVQIFRTPPQINECISFSGYNFFYRLFIVVRDKYTCDRELLHHERKWKCVCLDHRTI